MEPVSQVRTQSGPSGSSDRRVALFDLGGVLIDWDPRRLYGKLIPDAALMEWFLTQVCSPEWNAEQDLGRPFADGVAELIERFPDQAELIRAYHERWEEMLGDALQGADALLSGLRSQDIKLIALSNWSRETFPVARRRFRLLELFDGIVVSGDEGLAKPDPAIFLLTCERYGFTPDEAIFIDDSPTNVAVAERLGFLALLFTSMEDLKTRLAEVGWS